MGWTHFLTKTLARVRTEMSLHVLAYNLKRVMRILGIEELMRAMRAMMFKSAYATLFWAGQLPSIDRSGPSGLHGALSALLLNRQSTALASTHKPARP